MTRDRKTVHLPAGFFILPILTLLITGCGSGEPDGGYADLVLLGGNVITVDEQLGQTQALAVRGHKIVAVGGDDEVSGLVGRDTRVVELNGRTAIPGFIEGHGHYMSLGRALQILDLTAVDDYGQIVEMVAGAVEEAEPGEWIFGRGWHQDKWNQVPRPNVDGVPLNDTLSAISPDNPVYLTHASGHASFANDAALAAAGIGPDTPNPDGGTIVRTTDGEATGLLRENAQDLVEAAVQDYQSSRPAGETERIRRERVRLAADEALRNGVTSFHDAGVDFDTIDFYRKLEQEGALPIRIYAMIRYESNQTMAEKLPQYRMVAEGNDYLAVRSIKRQIDGALGSHGAWLLQPYADLEDNTGLVLEPVEEIERTAELASEHDYQLNTHAIGTRANREVLDLYQRTWRRTDTDGGSLRWRIEHAQHVHPDDIPRFGKLGVLAAVQGIHCTSDGPWIPSRLGEERTRETSYRWRDLIDSGATLGNGTDVPVESIDPIDSYYASVARVMNNGEKFYPDQAMTRMEALKSYTINNAYLAFEEELKGSLTPGKLADITILDRDILTVAEAEIPETRVEYTIVGGEIVYQRIANR